MKFWNLESKLKLKIFLQNYMRYMIEYHINKYEIIGKL